LRRNSWHRCRYGNKWHSDNSQGDGAYVEMETCCIVIRKDGAYGFMEILGKMMKQGNR